MARITPLMFGLFWILFAAPSEAGVLGENSSQSDALRFVTASGGQKDYPLTEGGSESLVVSTFSGLGLTNDGTKNPKDLIKVCACKLKIDTGMDKAIVVNFVSPFEVGVSDRLIVDFGTSDPNDSRDFVSFSFGSDPAIPKVPPGNFATRTATENGGFVDITDLIFLPGMNFIFDPSTNKDDISLKVLVQSDVPEPATALLLGACLVALVSVHNRRRLSR
ncbi:MAG TPA: PEP-CTERM sorting domain-containing protein [Acetobacteraceae bacterium]|nr:PEP-CTERM sorting domain-containing protein [Acetobacteraceae bacterium]